MSENVYANCPSVQETTISSRQNRESAAYLDVNEIRNMTDGREIRLGDIGLQEFPPSNKAGLPNEGVKSKVNRTDGDSRWNQELLVMTVLATTLLLTLLNTVIVIWYSVSSQRAGLLSSEAPPSIKMLQSDSVKKESMLHNLSLAVHQNADAINHFEKRHERTFQYLSLTVRQNTDVIKLLEKRHEGTSQTLSLAAHQNADAIIRFEKRHEETFQSMSLAVRQNADAIYLSEKRHEGTFQNLSLAINQNDGLLQNMIIEITHILTSLSSTLNSVDGGVRNSGKKHEAIQKSLQAIKPSRSAIRLVNGTNSYSGRVEVLYHGEWGTVCDDSWDTNDASVICRMMGFSQAASAPTDARYGKGIGEIVLDDVQCKGGEDSVWNCKKSSWGVHNCGHNEDASVICVP